MIKLNHLIKKELVYEGLIHTVESSVASDHLKNWSISNNKFIVEIRPKKIFLKFKENLDEKELDNLLKLINNLGWFVSAVLVFKSELEWEKFNKDSFIKNYINKRLLSLQLEAKYDVELNIHDYDKLYHVSPSIFKDKILKLGIVPKSKEKITSHPDRIYLVDNEDDVDILAFQFKKIDPSIKAFSVFEIDFELLIRRNPSIRLFDDPNFKGGIYTLSNIPPQVIKYDGDIEL